ncbi:FUSC family protein [Aerococcaceae bacterium 50-4]
MRSLLKQTFTLKPSPNDHLERVLVAGLCTLIVNLTGYFLQNPGINATSSLGLFTFLHFQSFEGHRVMKRLFFVAMTIMVAYTVGLIIGQAPLLAPIFIALVAFFARLIYRIYRIDKPGDIFVILVIAAGATKDIPIQQIPLQLLELAYGVLISLIMAYLLVRYLGLPKQSYTASFRFKAAIRMEPRMVVDSFYYAAVLFFAAYLNIVLNLSPYSWIIVSCSAILQGNTLEIILNKSFQRIFGTIAGLATAALIILVPMPHLIRIAMIVVLYISAEYFIPRNYSMGIFFVTNMVLIQLTFQNPNLGFDYLGDRLGGIVIGTILGSAAAYLQYHLYKFYSQSLIQNRTYDYKEKMVEESYRHLFK